MAGPSNTTRSQLYTQNRCLGCRFCRNHIVSAHNNLGRFAEGAVDGMLCHAADNVRTDDTISPRFQYQKPVVSVSCNGCNKHIGERFVVPDPPNQGVFEGWYLFHLDRILFSDGTYLRYADTHQVAVVNEE